MTTRSYRLIMKKPGTDLPKRVAYAYFDNAYAQATRYMTRGAYEYSIVEIIEKPDGTKADGHSLAGGTREGNTISSSMTRNAALVIKQQRPEPLWWPHFAAKKGNHG